MLYHEKLDVYQLSIKLVVEAITISATMPKGHSSLADQFKRAAMSIPLNIAEGVGKPTSAERQRFHGIARGSAMECAAILDVARLLSGQESMVAIDCAKELLVRIVEMLTRMCR